MKGLTLSSPSGYDPSYYEQKTKAERKVGHKLTTEEFERDYYVPSTGSSLSATGTSVFDPVLCEIDYLWFTNKGDKIIDPFSGGSVRGIVASKMGREYFGVDLRQEQIDANKAQAAEILSEAPLPYWVCGDSTNIKEFAKGQMFDHIFTCPPYGDLEVYSDDERDISNMDPKDFERVYTDILTKSVSLLKNDRFATVVVGNYRDKDGYMIDLAGITIRAMESAGARYYNDVILSTPLGSTPIRCGIPFKKGRKIAHVHQFVLNFCKGNPRAATERMGEIEVPDLVGGEGVTEAE